MNKKIKIGQVIISALFLALYLYILISSYIDNGEFCTAPIKNVYSRDAICTSDDPVPFVITSLLIIGFALYALLTGLGLEVWHKNEDKDYWNRGKKK